MAKHTDNLMKNDSNVISVSSLALQIQREKLGHVDSRLWKEEWQDSWVMYADLLAFGARAKRSESVVLNNILRFDRASELVASWFPDLRVRRFSDSTFAISSTFHGALSFAIALSHCCLAFNLEYMVRTSHRMFHRLIVPRVTLAKGRVLLLPETPSEEPRFARIDAKNVIAGSAIVDAYHLEKASSGGLITVGADGLKELQAYKVRGNDGGVRNGLERWMKKLSDDEAIANGDVFCVRGKLVDIPWTLLRPRQVDGGSLWAASPADANVALRTYLEVWKSSMHSFYVPDDAASPLDTAKHYACAQRHGVQCFSMARGNMRPRFIEPSDVINRLGEMPAGLVITKDD
jgi:hypothetical protein